MSLYNPVTGDFNMDWVYSAVSGEDTSGAVLHGSAGFSLFGLAHRGGFSRGSVGIPGTTNNTLDPPNDRLTVSLENVPGAYNVSANCWVHGNLSWGTFGGGVNEDSIFLRFSSGGLTTFAVRGHATNGVKFSATASLTDVAFSASNVVPTLGLSGIGVDLKVKNRVASVHGSFTFEPGGGPTPASILGRSLGPDEGFYGYGVIEVKGSAKNDGTYEIQHPLYDGGGLLLAPGEHLNAEIGSATITEGPSVHLYFNNKLALRWFDPTSGTSAVDVDDVDFCNLSTSLGCFWSELTLGNSPSFGMGLVAMSPTGDLLLHEGPEDGIITFAAQPTPGDKITINTDTITFVASGATGDQINIGGNTISTAQNLRTFINSHTASLMVTAAGTAAVLTLTDQRPGIPDPATEGTSPPIFQGRPTVDYQDWKNASNVHGVAGDINAITATDTVYLQTQELNLYSLWTVAGSLPAGGYRLSRLKEEIRIFADTDSPVQTIKFATGAVLGGNVETLEARNIFAPTDAFGNYFHYWGDYSDGVPITEGGNILPVYPGAGWGVKSGAE